MPSPSHTDIPRRVESSSAPLSFIQEGLWMQEQWAPGTARHNMAMAMRVTGPLVMSALNRAFAAAVERHEILRTTFVERAGEPRQMIHPARHPAVMVADATVAGLRERDLLKRVKRAARRPFDLTRGPLLRVVVWRLAGEHHLLATTIHHIIGDGWSLDLLLREIIETYRHLLAARPVARPALRIQYGDYAAYERAKAGTAAVARQMQYWVTRLDGLRSLPLPRDRQPAQRRSFRGASQPWAVPSRIVERLGHLAQQHHATVFMLMLAALAALLRRYCHTNQIALASPMTTRQPETEPLIGPFVNTLVFRLDTPARLSFASLLAHARDTVIDGLAHGQVPFDRVLQQLRASNRIQEWIPINVMLAARPIARNDVELPGIRLRRLFLGESAAQSDLTLYLSPAVGELAGVINYSTELFAPHTIERLCTHFLTLLEAAVQSPDTPIGELSLLSAVERQHLLDQLSGATTAAPFPGCVHQLFERCADLTPDAVAVVRDDECLTYREVERRANDVAGALAAAGVRRGDVVAVSLERRPPLVFGLLGILKAGAAYLPLDPTVPRPRLEAMVADARPRAMLVDRALEPQWRGAAVPVRCADGGAMAASATARPRRTLIGYDIAYVIYTSGTTGEPKGVALPHRALTASTAAVATATAIGPGDRFLHFAPLGFDVTAFQLFPALTSGATAVLTPPPGELSHEDILRLCDDGLTILDLPAAVWQGFVDATSKTRDRLPASLRVFMTGGESTPTDIVTRWAKLVAGETTFISSYGPTETALTAIWTGHANQVRHWPSPSVALGRAVPNARLYVLDAGDQPVPLGVSGELCVAGVGLGHGYIGRPGATADRFRPDRFAAEPGSRMYRTGDLVRYGCDQHLTYEGRVDRQVKLNGVRVEVGEIEAVLRQHSQVRLAVVAPGRESTTTAPPALVAYVVAKDGVAVDESALRHHLADHLPRGVMPTAFCVLPSLPVTENGKIAYDRLPAPPATVAAPPPVAYTELEAILAGIWSDALAAPQTDSAADFFALGGHSLAATQMMARIRDVLGVDVPVRTIFEGRTFGALLREVGERRRQPFASAIVPLSRRDLPLAVSFPQLGFWLLDQMGPGSHGSANQEILRLSGELSVSAFAAALSTVAARHETLRTTFTVVDGEPKQFIGAPTPVSVPVVDVSALPGPISKRVARRIARRTASWSFDLATGPLLRAMLIRTEANGHLLLLHMHHVISDGWSMQVLLEEVQAGYRAVLRGVEPCLPPLPLQYADYAAWQRVRWSEEALDAAAERRRARAGEAFPSLELPIDRPRPAASRFLGDRLPLALGAELADRARALARGSGTTLFIVLLTALKALLHLYTGQRVIVVAAPAANRLSGRTERLIGLFINHLIIATRVERDWTYRELLAHVRTATLDAFDDPDLPFDALVARLRPARLGTYTPVTRVLCNLLTLPAFRLELPGVDVEPPPFRPPHRPRFDLEWSFTDIGGRLSSSVGFDAELFDRATVGRMGADYAAVLRALLATPDRRLSTMQLSTPHQAALAGAFSAPF